MRRKERWRRWGTAFETSEKRQRGRKIKRKVPRKKWKRNKGWVVVEYEHINKRFIPSKCWVRASEQGVIYYHHLTQDKSVTTPSSLKFVQQISEGSDWNGTTMVTHHRRHQWDTQLVFFLGQVKSNKGWEGEPTLERYQRSPSKTSLYPIVMCCFYSPPGPTQNTADDLTITVEWAVPLFSRQKNVATFNCKLRLQFLKMIFHNRLRFGQDIKENCQMIFGTVYRRPKEVLK